MGKTSGGGRDGGMKARRKRRSGRRGGKRRNEERVAERGRARTMMQGLELVRVVQGAYQKGCGQSRGGGRGKGREKRGWNLESMGRCFFLHPDGGAQFGVAGHLFIEAPGEGISSCRFTGPKGDLIESAYDSVVASQSLQEKITWNWLKTSIQGRTKLLPFRWNYHLGENDYCKSGCGFYFSTY